MTELSDADVFGSTPKEMSDSDVFGAPKPAAVADAPPEAFLHRLALGMMIGGSDPSPAELRAKGLEDFDVATNTVNQFKAGLDRVKKGFQDTHSSIDVGMGAFGALTAPLTAAFQALGGAGEKATGGILSGEQINTALMLGDGAPGTFARVRNGAPEVIGSLPTPQDFTNAAKVLAPETITAAALRSKEGGIFTGTMHGDALTALQKADHTVGTEADEGFTTSTGRFVDRAEALDLANKAGQRAPTPDRGGIKFKSDEGLMAHEIFDADGNHVVQNLKQKSSPPTAGLRLVEAPEGGVYEPGHIKPNEKYFKAVDADGNPAAEMLVRFDGNTANVEDILAPGKPREEGRGTIGAADLRSLLRQFQETHPEIEKITGKRVSGARMDGGYSLTDEAANVEINLRHMWQQDGIHPAEAVHDAQADAFIKNEITSKREEVKLDPETEHILTETGGRPGSLSAAVTDPADIPLDVQPARPPGSLAAAFKEAGDKLMDMGRDAQMLVAPMATGTRDSMAIAKDFANSVRRNRWDWSRIDSDIADKFTPEQRARMWNASDEESLSLRLDEPASMREHQGLNTLEPAERAMVEELQTRSQNAWVRARDVGMVEGEGLPAYTPRMIINVASAGTRDTALALDGIGGNLRTKTGNLLKRKYLEAQETEAAAKAKYGDQALLARDIRVLPLATSQLEDAIAGRTLINNIKDYGERTGAQTVSEGAIPADAESKWFTLDHPAFKTWRPKLEDGKALKDENGNAIFEQVPLYVHGDFEGPLRAVLSQKSGALYGGMMALKGKTMSLIMNSPMIHNAVEWGRAFPAAPFKVGTFKVYFDGNAAKNNVPLMHEAIDNGLVPIGHRFFNQDITSVMESPDLTPGRSLTAKLAALVPGMFDEAAGTAVKRAIDKAGDFWHNTLLWDRVGDLQMGLYKTFLDANVQNGMDRATAAKIAAHGANRFAGSLPKEAMSDGATKLSNLMLFSRSFTMGNLGVMKDMLTGLPKDVIAQIERDADFPAGSINEVGELNSPVEDAVKAAKSIARRRAMGVVAVDVGLYLVGNSIMQSALNVLLGSNSIDQELHGYMRRFKDYLDNGSQNPLSMLWPGNIAKLSSTSENEPGLESRLKIGHTKDGTAIYARNPVGKIGEEFVGWATSPLDMLRKKEGTIARPLLQILSNDGGFGRKIYDPDADTPTKYAGSVWAIAKHLAGSQLPEGQLTALSDLVHGDGDKTVNELQLAGPLAGVTFRKGAPGGEAVGEMYHNKSAFEFRVQQAMPDIRRQIQRGDVPGAQQAMTNLGMDASYSRWVIKTTQNPATRLGAKALGDFYRTATPEQRDRMTRIQQAPQQP